MVGICEGRTVIITGAARGIGRAYALEFARQGAAVVVNDLGAGPGSAAQAVVDEIIAAGGRAVANGDDVASWSGAENLIQTAISAFGGLDVLVNNAGFVRDRSIVKMSEEEWDSVVRVHLKGAFAPLHFAAVYWKDKAAAGEPVDARVINTTSRAGLKGSVGQANYASAKAGIASLTLGAALELGKFGVTVNAISPGALTQMTAALGMDKVAQKAAADGFDFTDPANVAPLAVWLGSADARDITGQVIEIFGGKLKLCQGWTESGVDKKARWDVTDIGPMVRSLMAK